MTASNAIKETGRFLFLSKQQDSNQPEGLLIDTKCSVYSRPGDSSQFLDHLSQRLKVRYCDRSLSVVGLSVMRKPLL